MDAQTCSGIEPMIWKLKKTEEAPDEIGPVIREIASNDDGVSIEPWGASAGTRQIFFKYQHRDIAIEFSARRSPRCVVEPGEVEPSGPPYPIGPLCEVWLDVRQMKFGGRPLSDEEMASIKETVTDFLTTVFCESRLAVLPYAKQVEIT